MDSSPNLDLPYLMAAQAQKHVTHNEALRRLDAVVQLTVLDRDLSAPPATPTDGDRYLVADNATAAWTGSDDRIAAWQDGAWAFFVPREGWLAWIADEDALVVWDGAGWVAVAGGGTSAPLFGINTTPDTTNRLAAKSDAVLLSHDDVTPGSGDMRVKVNKAAAGNTASYLFQDGYSGRAEVGLTGDDDFHFKVSPDGATWKDAIVIDRATGAVAMAYTAQAARQNLLINGDFQINQRAGLPSGAFTGGALSPGIYGYDRWKAETGGADVTRSGYTVTLASGTLVQIIEPALIAGVSSLASTQVTISVEAPSADVSVSFGSVSGTITAGSGRRAVTLTTGAGDTGNLSFKIAKSTAGSVTFGRVKLEVGNGASRWEPRVDAVEEALCWRYYQFTGGPIAAPALADGFSSRDMFIGFRGPMRVVPSMTLNWVDGGGTPVGSTGGVYGGTTTGINAWRAVGSTTLGVYIQFWAANAEL